jgi:hypothetical protein
MGALTEHDDASRPVACVGLAIQRAVGVTVEPVLTEATVPGPLTALANTVPTGLPIRQGVEHSWNGLWNQPRQRRPAWTIAVVGPEHHERLAVTQARTVREADLDAGGDAGGAGRIGDLQGAGEGCPLGVLLTLGKEEELGVVAPGFGVID